MLTRMESSLATVVCVRFGEGVANSSVKTAILRQLTLAFGGVESIRKTGRMVVTFDSPQQAILCCMALRSSLEFQGSLVRSGVCMTGALRVEQSDLAEANAISLSELARSGEMLLPDDVRKSVAPMPGIDFMDRGTTHLKGRSGTCRLYAVALSTTGDPRPVLLGRDAELDFIRESLHGVRMGTGGILLVEGEAGIGKSRLVEELSSLAMNLGLQVVAGAADEIERDRPGRIMEGWSQGLDIRPDSWGASGDGIPAYAAIEGILDAVDTASLARPLVLIAEDLHWADDLSLRGIAAVLRRISRLPVLMVLTSRMSPRSVLLKQVLGATESHSAGVRKVVLAGLGAKDSAGLAALVTGVAPGTSLTNRIAGAGGNPLFVVELLRSLGDEGALRVEAGLAECSSTTMSIGLQETLLRRLAGLPDKTRELLRLASLLGTEFHLTDVATVASCSVVEAAAFFEEALQASVITGDASTLAFRHDLVREAVYESIAPAIRSSLHLAAARSLASADSPPLQVAGQFLRSGCRDLLDAAVWLERAASAVRVLDPGSAATLLEQALAIAPADWDERQRVESELIEPLASSGRIREAQGRATALLDQELPAPLRAATMRGLASVLASAGDLGAAARCAEEASLLPDLPSAERDLLRCYGASMAILAGKPVEELSEMLEKLLSEPAISNDHGLQCWAEQAFALRACTLGRFDEALGFAEASRRRLDRNDVPSLGFLIPHIWEGTMHFFLDEIDEALACYARARRRAEKRGDVGMLVLIHAGTAGVQFVAGRWSDAAAEIKAGLDLAEETGVHSMSLICHSMNARMALSRGDIDEAEQSLGRGTEVIQSGSHLFGVDMHLWAQALLFEVKGDTQSALALLTGLWEQLVHVRYFVQYRSFVPDLVRLACVNGETSLANSVASEVAAISEQSSSRSARAVALRCRGLVDRDPNPLSEAVTLYQATARNFELAGCCEDAAAVLFNRQRIAEAVPLLDEAAAIYAGNGSGMDASRVDATLRAHGQRRRRNGPAREQFGWGSLSVSEVAVARLIAQGLSNPQIAERLYISRRTVESHLSHAYRKLRVESRTQLALLASQHLEGSDKIHRVQ